MTDSVMGDKFCSRCGRGPCFCGNEKPYPPAKYSGGVTILRDPELRRAALEALLAYETWSFTSIRAPEAEAALDKAMDALKGELAK